MPENKPLVLTVLLRVVLTLVFVVLLRLKLKLELELELELELAVAGLEAKGLRTSPKGSAAAGCHHPTC